MMVSLRKRMTNSSPHSLKINYCRLQICKKLLQRHVISYSLCRLWVAKDVIREVVTGFKSAMEDLG